MIRNGSAVLDEVAPDGVATAIAHYRAGSFQRAASLFAALRAQDPENAVLLRLNGLSLVRGGQAPAGVTLLSQAHRLAPDDPLSSLHLGVGLHATGALAEAVSLFRHCVAIMPGQSAPLINLAVALLDHGDAKAARDTARAAVAIEAGSADAHLVLGRACAACNEQPAAVAAFEECVRLRPRDTDAWVSFGLALYRFSEADAAIAALHRALAISPGHSLAEANLAAFQGLRGEQAEAVARLRAVLAREPGCVAARLNLANLLLHERDAAGALALLPEPPPAGREGMHWRAQRVAALLMLGRREEARSELAAATGPPGDAEITLTWLRIALDDTDLEQHDAVRAEWIARLAWLAETDGTALPEHRIIGHFDLADLRTRQGRQTDAFDHWRKAHALLGRMQPFSRNRHAAFVAATRQQFDADRCRFGARADNADTTPVFIVGMPRSGTSLTEQILSAHPMVHGAGERLAVHDLVMHLAGSVFTPDSVARLAALDAAALSATADRYLDALHRLAPKARTITDKMPGNALHLGSLSTLLPGARVIRCTRDPRDIGLSIFQRRFFGYHPYAHDLGDLGWYIGQHEIVMRHWENALPIPMISIALTDWVRDFDATLARLLDFLDLPPDPACQRFYEIDRRVGTASRDQVRRPINAAGIGRWRDYEAQLQPLIAELAAAGLLQSASPVV
jgi:tetratricopeptide (TPR) repeat protein